MVGDMVAQTLYQDQGDFGSEVSVRTEQHTCDSPGRAQQVPALFFGLSPKEEDMIDKYANRPDYVRPVAISLEREADEYLRSICGAKNIGRVLSSLVLQERARREERVKIIQELRAGVETVHVADCIYNQPGLQSAHFSDHINCLYRHTQDRINCH
jgi:hypothetical protein